MERLARRAIILVLTLTAALIIAAPAFAETEPLEDYLLRNLKNRETEINVSEYHIPTEERQTLFNTYNKILETHPECTADYLISFRDVGEVREVYKVILRTAEKYPDSYKYPDGYKYSEQDMQEFYGKVNGILDQVEPGWTDFQKILFIHDYLVVNIEYDFDYLFGGAVEAIWKGYAVCDGYSKAFKYLMWRLDIPCEFISSQDEDHAWNAVQMDGKYYYLDVTWDDADWGDFWPDFAEHENFLLTTKEMYGVHHTDDWVLTDGRNAKEVITADTKLESGLSFIQSVRCMSQQEGNKVYYYKQPENYVERAAAWEFDAVTKENRLLFSYIDSVSVSYSSNGVTVPNLKVKLKDGTVLAKDSYTTTFTEEFNGVDSYGMTLKVNGYEHPQCYLIMYVEPPKTSIVKVVPRKKGFTVKWKKMSDEVTGYRIRYSTHSDFSGGKTIKITNKDKTSYTVKKLKRKKRYYVTVYTYLKKNGDTFTSGYCKKKKVVTK